MENKAFILNNLAYGFIDIISKYVDLFSDDEIKQFKDVCDGLNSLDEDHNNFLADVKYYFNFIIDIATGLEDQMTQADKDDIEDKHTTIKNLDALDDLYEGQLVMYEGKPYQIYEIDYDDMTICIGYNQMENGSWVDPIDVTI